MTSQSSEEDLDTVDPFVHIIVRYETETGRVMVDAGDMDPFWVFGMLQATLENYREWLPEVFIIGQDEEDD